MKKIIFTLFSFCSLLFSVGTYDSYTFTDEEEKYALHFLNTALTTEITGSGLSTADSTAILGLRPITSLTTVASNANITGRDMLFIRSRSYAVDIPDHSVYNQYTALGIKQYEYNFFMAFLGSLFGFTFVFFLIYNVVNISRGLKD